MALWSGPQTSFDIITVPYFGLPGLVQYRIAVGSTVKYFVTSERPSGPLNYLDRTGDYLGFSSVPVGDWNVATLVRGAVGKLVIASIEKRPLPDVTEAWHSTTIELLALERLDRLPHPDAPRLVQMRGHVPSGVFPGSKRLGVNKIAAFWNVDFEGADSHGLAQESHIYSLINDMSIAPKFLAHLTDNQERIVGYVLESIRVRVATQYDLVMCENVLRKLHAAGIAHGFLRKDAFLIREGGTAALMQFLYSSYETTDKSVFDEEMEMLPEILQQNLE